MIQYIRLTYWFKELTKYQLIRTLATVNWKDKYKTLCMYLFKEHTDITTDLEMQWEDFWAALPTYSFCEQKLLACNEIKAPKLQGTINTKH